MTLARHDLRLRLPASLCTCARVSLALISCPLVSHGERVPAQVCKDHDEKDDEQMLLCEGCDLACHTFCCDPPLESIPKGDWFCDECKKKRKEAKKAARKSGK